MNTDFGTAVWMAALLALLVCFVPAASQASQKCQCENGVIVHAMDDSDDACEDACSGMGGGQVWSSEDDEDDDGDDVEVIRRPTPKPAAPRHR